MSRRLLIVTGSRALADTPDAKAWAEEKIRMLLSESGFDVLFTGGCPNCPDEWAREYTEKIGRQWVEYRLDGMRYSSDGETRRWTEDKKFHPHARNRKLIEIGRTLSTNAGWACRVGGFLAPWSPTLGAFQTIKFAEEAKLQTTVFLAPECLKPKERQ